VPGIHVFGVKADMDGWDKPANDELRSARRFSLQLMDT
jgi:hypothetical protein